jgi:hypothetical protein
MNLLATARLQFLRSAPGKNFAFAIADSAGAAVKGLVTDDDRGLPNAPTNVADLPSVLRAQSGRLNRTAAIQPADRMRHGPCGQEVDDFAYGPTCAERLCT